MMKFLIAGFFSLFIVSGAAIAADDCLMYKTNPRIDIVKPEYTKKVEQPDEKLDKMHGTVVATLVDNFDIMVTVSRTLNGYCVALKSVKATVGFSDFLVQIDASNVPDSCEYNAVLNHEDKHINTYLGVIDDFQTELHETVFAAAKSVMPVYIRRPDDVDLAINKLNEELQSHPDIVLIKQKIQNEEELRNKQIDLNEDNSLLHECNKD